jgi:superfamily II DNA or RNA helicase/HKD family nuclease/diadenosine tetraphosphate (Ap4A) HIT family hydrolase/SOS-response transcriptional repressor LexA
VVDPLVLRPGSWVASNPLADATFAADPVAPGHVLIFTRRVVQDWGDASPPEQAAVLELVADVRARLDLTQPRPTGYTVGFEVGEVGGERVPRLCVHVIPRHRGDEVGLGPSWAAPRGMRAGSARRTKPFTAGGAADRFALQLAPLFGVATDIAIVAAFTQASGLGVLRGHLFGALRRGARVRVLTGDYLDITQVEALELLRDWMATAPRPRPQPDLGEDDDDDQPTAEPTFEARVVEVANLPGREIAFHPKSWRFEEAAFGVAFVGSSNISRSALETGIEWNLAVERERDPEAYGSVREAFERLWVQARVIDDAWIAAYARRQEARAEAPRLPTGEIEAEPAEVVPEPHEVQREALQALREARARGQTRALVVLATGLGKTWLAAFDLRAFIEARGPEQTPRRLPRLLFVAHRRELLQQAARTYRRLLRAMGLASEVGWFVGTSDELGAELVFASVAKLARPSGLDALRAQAFDYVVIDEVHHAAAESYRRILEVVRPRFLLGLTATPDRADEADIAGMFDDHVAYRADIARGVAVGRLVPFRYLGVKDDIDYASIPWRNRRFDPAALAAAVQTEARMESLWRAWTTQPATRTLIFCASVAHAEFVKAWLGRRGVRVAAVFSGPTSDDRDASIQRLERGELDALCSVDVFNEGVDVPSVDRVVMLRPTESNVVFLQQLGRGLRVRPGKDAVLVIDFVGNHRVFLQRLRALLSLAGGPRPPSVRAFLEGSTPLSLPAGCAVALELEAKTRLLGLLRAGGGSEVERMYRELRAARDVRPRAGELERLGYLPSTLRERYGSWFGFVGDAGDLTDDELRVVASPAGAFLRALEGTPSAEFLRAAFVEAWVSDDEATEAAFEAVVARVARVLRRSPELGEAARAAVEGSGDRGADDLRWVRDALGRALADWTDTSRERRPWFRVEHGRVVAAARVSASDWGVFAALARELADYVLARARARLSSERTTHEGFVCRVTWNQRDPILKLPTRRDHVPTGETDVRVDGQVWSFSFRKEFCNVARPVGTQRNQLPDLLRRWFGPTAGRPGSAFSVRFYASPDGLWAEPVGAQVIVLSRREVVTYPDLRTAAGYGLTSHDASAAATVCLPLDAVAPDLFAVRVVGSSMDGGRTPLRDGDWAVLRRARSQGPEALRGRVVLVESPGTGDGMRHQLKRLSQDEGRWRFVSDNPLGPSFDAEEAHVVTARLEAQFSPEQLAPAVGTVFDEDEAARAFDVGPFPARTGRVGGHLFVLVDRPGLLSTPELVRAPEVMVRASETAYVLARRPDGLWRYRGVGRWSEEEQGFRISEVDFARGPGR